MLVKALAQALALVPGEGREQVLVYALAQVLG